MATEDRVKVLEGEFKLIKGEVRQTLSSVRDFLLDIKLPSMQEEPGLTQETEAITTPETVQDSEENAGADNGGGDKGSEGSGLDGFGPEGIPQDQMPDFSGMDQVPDSKTAGEPAAEGPATETLPPLDLDTPDDQGMSSGNMPGSRPQIKNEDEEAEETAEKEVHQPGTAEEEEGDTVSQDNNEMNRSSVPQVNLLANLIRWVANAKKEIGVSQLPVFLDVYATTGKLTPEMKDIILHLAEVATNPSLAEDTQENGQIISEQLKLCMEINRSSAQLPDDIKLKIQRLTELLLQQSIQYNKADVWSSLLVDLHGILSGGGAPLRSLQSIAPMQSKVVESTKITEKQVEEELDNPEDVNDENLDDDVDFEYTEPVKNNANTLQGKRQARLRLIMPTSEGEEQSLDLGNLFIATDSVPKPVNRNKKANSLRK
jgi:hypothetical protein